MKPDKENDIITCIYTCKLTLVALKHKITYDVDRMLKVWIRGRMAAAFREALQRKKGKDSKTGYIEVRS